MCCNECKKYCNNICSYNKLIHICNTTHFCVCHDWSRPCQCDTDTNHSFIRVTWLNSTCDVTQFHVWRDSFVCVTWLIRMCDMTLPDAMSKCCNSCNNVMETQPTHPYAWRDSILRVTWLVQMHCLLHPNECEKYYKYYFLCVTWLIPMCDMTHPDAAIFCRHNQLVDTCNMTHLDVWRDSLLRVTWLIQMPCQCAATSVRSTTTWQTPCSSFLRVTWQTPCCSTCHTRLEVLHSCEK